MNKLSLREKQSIFTLNVAKLIKKAYDIGYEITFGEALRTKDQQILYFEGLSLLKTGGNIHFVRVKPASKTMFSKHLDKLAIDLNIFVDGVWKTDAESYKPLAEYWHSLHEDNVCGFDWGWDFNHFQMS